MAIPFSKHHFFQTDNQKQVFYSVFVVRAVFQLRWRKKTDLKRRPLFRSQIFKFSNFVATSEACIWLAICEFLWLLTNHNVWFVTSFALNLLSSALNYLKTEFILTNQNWVIFHVYYLLFRSCAVVFTERIMSFAGFE